MSDKILKLSDPIFHNRNFEAMKNDLMLNNYPANFITKYFEDHKKRIQYQSVSMKELIDFNKIFVLTHIKFYTKELSQILQEKYGFKVVYNYPFMLEKNCEKSKRSD